MEQSQLNYASGDRRESQRAAGFRLVRVVVVEALLVAFVGLLIWGVAWDLGYPTAGLVIAIVIWLTVSPVIEIATVVNYRKSMTPNGDHN